MKKLLTTAALVLLLLALLAGMAFADAGFDNFREQQPYDGRFTDVKTGDWFYESVAQAQSYGLIQGMTSTTFAPNGTLTWAEGITLAARLHSMYNTGSDDFGQSTPWYKVYTDYALKNGILTTAPAAYGAGIPRGAFATLLVNGLPAEALEPVNDVPEGSIPDVLPAEDCHDAVYTLYRAGVLTGNDATGVALAGNTLRRSEAAAILIRMAKSDARVRFSLSEQLTVYRPGDKTSQIHAIELAKAEAQGWYRVPVTQMYNPSGTAVVPTDQVDDYIKKGWSREPFTPVPDAFKSQTSTTIPVISVSTGGKEVLSRETYVSCTVNTYNTAKETTLSGTTGGIRVRGNSSSYYGNVSMIRTHTVPYRIKFDSKVNLMGLNDGAKCKSWVLLTSNEGVIDPVKNDIALRMGRMIVKQDGYYCSDAQLVNFFLNGKYQGVYLLCEQNQVNKNRVNVAEPEDGDTSLNVGYLVEIDNYSEKPCFRMNYEGATVTDVAGTTRTFRGNDYSVKSETFSQAQVDFIAKYIRGVFKIVYQACEKGNFLTFDANYNVVPSGYKNAQECISAVADLRSMANMLILYELMCDYDVGEGSFYMCVDFSEGSKFPKLTFTAPWDWEWTCSASTSGFFASTFRSSSFISSFGDRSNPWFIVLYKQWWFRDMVKARWAEIGGAQGVAKCIAEENALIDLYGRDMLRKNGYAVDGSRSNLRWIQNRANWLETQW